MWSLRSTEQELIDLGHYSQEEYEDCLVKLGEIGKWLGGDRIIFQALKRMHPQPSSLLDVGCGGGSLTRKLAIRYPKAKVVGIDLNPHAVNFAKKGEQLINLSFESRLQGKLEEPEKSYDLVFSSLVCHHLDDEALVDFIKRSCRVARRKVIISDLHRHPLAYFLFKAISPIFFRNRLIQNDGPLSIRRSFHYSDWVGYLKKSGTEAPSILYQLALALSMACGNSRNMSEEKCVIIGGGVAGLSVANQLVDAGLKPLLIDSGKYPAHRICGEFFSHEALPILERWKIPLPTRIDRCSFIKGEKKVEFKLPIAAGSHSRFSFDAALLERAKSKGARILTETSILSKKSEGKL